MKDRLFLDPFEVIKALKGKGIEHVFHANSIETSLSFLRHGALLSREECNRRKAPMSWQPSDKTDIKYGIFDDLFFNLRDLHNQFECANQYGPILFKVSLSRLEKFFRETNAKVGVTTWYIPHKWQDDDPPEKRWNKEVKTIFNASYPDIVIQFPHMSLEHIDEIVIDKIPDRPHFFDQAKVMYETCAKAHGVKIKISARACAIKDCKCSSCKNIKWPTRYRAGKWQDVYGHLDDVA